MKQAAALAMKLVLALLVQASPARAQSCSFFITDFDFGSFVLPLKAAITTSATFSVNCRAKPYSTIHICPNFGGGSGGAAAGGDSRSMTNGRSAMTFDIYKTSSYSRIWGSYFWGRAAAPRSLALTMGGSGVSGWVSFPVYARVAAGQGSVAPGTFTSSFSGTDSLVAYAYASAGSCEKIAGTNGVALPFTVRANGVSTCALSATSLDFGSHGALDANVDSTNQLKLSCTKGASYAVGLSGGVADAADPRLRKMLSRSDQISYGLYRDAARSLPWGNVIGANTLAGIGSGETQAITIYGRVGPQRTPAPGTYTDIVVVTVTY